MKPYRANAGIALFNLRGRVLIARRLRDDGPETILPGYEWQMPQGGIDPSEEGPTAACRELWEETGVTSAEVIGRLSAPLRYDFPPYDGPSHKLSRFAGQEQVWYAMRFLGSDDEIDVDAKRNGEEPEFDRWRWERLDAIPDLVVPFKRRIYERVAVEFRPFAAPA